MEIGLAVFLQNRAAYSEESTVVGWDDPLSKSKGFKFDKEASFEMPAQLV